MRVSRGHARGIGRLESLATLAATRLAAGRILRRLPRRNADDPAVVLFTSGSESTPKTVPLSHANLLTNVAAGLEVIAATADDRLLAFLPPFHSFGLTGNVLLPAVAGIPSVLHADPTDAHGLVRVAASHEPTLLFTTPTFLGHLLAACRGSELQSLRVIVTAEKCPEAVFAACRRLAPQATILEGYGITECTGGRGQPARRREAGHDRPAGPRRGGARRRSRVAPAAGRRRNGHAPRPRAVGVQGLPPARRAGARS